MASATEIRRIFREHGLAPKKWMGQNLLVDRRYLQRIADAAEIQPGEHIMEIGAGLGVLTEELIGRGARVRALEIDSGFFRVLQDKFADRPGVELIHADALKYNFHDLAGWTGRLKVVANLPYSISSRLLFRVCRDRHLFGVLNILLQKEVADRLISEPGTKDYGMLTALLGVTAHVRILFTVPPAAFYPRPEVNSAMVRIEFPEPPPVPVADSRALVRLVKFAFSGRRKTLRNKLKTAGTAGFSAEMLDLAAQTAGIDLGRRGETLSPLEFARFADALDRVKNDPL